MKIFDFIHHLHREILVFETGTGETIIVIVSRNITVERLNTCLDILFPPVCTYGMFREYKDNNIYKKLFLCFPFHDSL